MDLINHTPYPALLFRTTLQDDILAASVSTRVTYNISNSKALINNSQHWELHKTAWLSEYCLMASDYIYKRNGIDIFAFGSARLPSHELFSQMDVSISIADKFSHTLKIFGERYWEAGLLGGLSKSKIIPVTEVPLNLCNAYGGNAQWDGLKIPYENNPLGKGYYWKKEDAINKPLPNIEHPAHLIVKWDDKPDPVGLVPCPMNELHLRNNLEINKDTKQIIKINSRIFNDAFPEMIVPEILPGEKIVIRGMTKAKDFIFEIPENNLYALIKLGKKLTERPLQIDQIGIIPEKNEAFMTYRFPFRYPFEPMQKRSIEIHEKK